MPFCTLHFLPSILLMPPFGLDGFECLNYGPPDPLPPGLLDPGRRFLMDAPRRWPMLSDLVDTREAEKTFQFILNLVDSQAKDILMLKTQAAALQAKLEEHSTGQVECRKVQDRLDRRVQAMEVAIDVPNAKEMSLGSIVSANYVEIVHLREKMKRKVDGSLLQDVCRRLQDKCTEGIDTVLRNAVSIEQFSRYVEYYIEV